MRCTIRGVEHGRALGPRLLPKLLDRGTRTGFLDPVADDPLEFGCPCRRQSIRRVHLDGLLVFEQRRVELILRFEITRLADVIARRVLHRPLELDLVLRVVRARLECRRVVLHGRVPIAGTRRFAPLPERPTGRAS